MEKKQREAHNRLLAKLKIHEHVLWESRPDRNFMGQFKKKVIEIPVFLKAE